MSDVTVFDEALCELGEGPLWHPERGAFFWFDINACRLFMRDGGDRRMWQFPGHVSAAGWIDHDRLMVAAEHALLEFQIDTGAWSEICPLEAKNPVTRPNDGRADPQGGFWIGTMGKALEPEAGAIYRYYRGELRQLYAPWTVPNAICFSPDGGCAYFADTPKGTIWRQRLDGEGWPEGEPERFLTLDPASYRPDGAVVDTKGNLWCAQVGHGKVSVFSPLGVEIETLYLPATRITCPAFTGPKLNRLVVTTARDKLETPTEHDGQTLAVTVAAKGLPEPRVIL